MACVDHKGEKISKWSCRDGDEAGTDFLRCGQDCFIPCEGGVAASQEATEVLIGYKRTLTRQICQDLCQMAKGCISYNYIHHTKAERDRCTLKCILEQADTSDTCKGK